ncbi:MAG TPA: hypothetical protein VII45_00995 [Solirubrobacterales bacterium]
MLLIDIDLLAGLGGEERERAERSCLAPVVELPKGAWDSDGTPGIDRSGFGLLVLSGALCRRVVRTALFSGLGIGSVFTEYGAFAAGGAFDFLIGAGLFLAWVLLASIALMRKLGNRQAPTEWP